VQHYIFKEVIIMADPVTASLVLGAGGMALKGIKGVVEYNTIQEQKAMANRQLQMQLVQNQAGADVTSINTLKQANALYDKQLTASASSGASLSSGSFADIYNSTFDQQQNKEFINQANLDVANLNTLYGAQQQQKQLQAMQTASVINTGVSIAESIAQTLGAGFTGSLGSKPNSPTIPTNQFGGGINNPFGSNLSSKTGSSLSLFNFGG
jgi:hypothetical protein